ncbi:hypothetical protein [Herbiconiux solani]|uniref:hypothetical protein n=1 Tax=Herbiconiux solani TaxID=661329 RepID=UPI0008262581|nr:hypothetical protein [Herbiconiux solani]
MQSIWAAKIFGDKEDPRVRLQALFGGALPAAGQPSEPALAWAHEVLRTKNAGPSDVVTDIRTLRKADSRLTLKAATFLAHHV